MFTVIIFSSFFIVNLNKVSAARVNTTPCNCFYTGISGDYNIYYQIHYGPNAVTIAQYCTTRTDGIGYPDCGGTKGRCEDEGCFEVAYKTIYIQGCEVSACNSANLYAFYDNGAMRLTTESNGASLSAISEDEWMDIIGDIVDVTDDGSDISSIIEWGGSTASSLYSVSDYDTCDLIDGDIKDLIEMVLTWISIAGIVILLIMSIMEFVKALTAGDSDGRLKTAFKNTLIRIACVAILLLLPMLISALIDAVNDNNYQEDDDGSYIIGSEGEPLCKINKNN